MSKQVERLDNTLRLGALNEGFPADPPSSLLQPLRFPGPEEGACGNFVASRLASDRAPSVGADVN